MIKLNKIRLINWHLFANECKDMEEITFLTGANGTGKSTVIDALQIVLLGDTTGRNFNKAANDRTGRTLRGYLKCETGESESGEIHYLRDNQRFTSYICLQFYNDRDESNFTLGVVFDYYKDDTEEHHFFRLNSAFPENDFTNVDLIDDVTRPLTYKEFLEYCKGSMPDGSYKFYDTSTEYQNELKRVFGDISDKYFTLFKKAVSFTPITNISSFITDFVCDLDHNIKIDSLQKNIEQYKLLEVEAKNLQVKLDTLTVIKDSYDNFVKIKNDLKLCEYLSDRADYEQACEQLENDRRELSSIQLKIATNTSNIRDYRSSLDDFKKQKENYIIQKVGMDGYQASNSLSLQKKQLEEKLGTLELNYNALLSSLNQYTGTFSKSAKSFTHRFTDLELDFMEEKERQLMVEFLGASYKLDEMCEEINEAVHSDALNGDQVKNFQSFTSDYKQKAYALKRYLDDDIYTIQEEKNIIQSELYEMKSGRKPFSQRYLEVKGALEEQLKKAHPNAIVSIYCDLVDITDSRWTKAIEAAIFSQKFNFFVSPAYYEEASEMLAEITRYYKFYGVSIVDSEKLISRSFQAKRGSVAEVIETDHEGARAYTNFLLGNIQRCETFAEARESGSGLLPNCTGYRNFSSWYLNLNNASEHYIGTKVDENTMFNKNQRLNELNKYFEYYTDIANHLQNISGLETMSSNESNTYASDLDERKKMSQELDRNLASLENQLNEGTLADVHEIDIKIDALDRQMNETQDEIDQMISDLGTYNEQVKVLTETTIPNDERHVDMLRVKLQSYDSAFVEEKCEPVFANTVKVESSFDKIKQVAQTKYVQTSSRLKGAKEKLVNARSAYTANYKLSYDVTNEDTNREFDSDYERLSQDELPRYQVKINDAHNKAVKEFKDDFIYKIRTSIETVKSQIDDLNLALKDVKFGRDSFRFSVQPNKDYLEYYEMITDDLLLNVGDASDRFLEKYKDIMNNLFALISDSTVGKSAEERDRIYENVAKFTDYRTYLVFDLLVKRGNSEESSLARTFKRQSGGETQTPFYISILASFAQLYRANQSDDTLRLVIFDEAFSKMDGARIKEAVNLLRSFKLQAILSTPSEKLTDLFSEVDLVLVAIHDVKSTRSYLDKWVEKDKKPISSNN